MHCDSILYLFSRIEQCSPAGYRRIELQSQKRVSADTSFWRRRAELVYKAIATIACLWQPCPCIPTTLLYSPCSFSCCFYVVFDGYTDIVCSTSYSVFSKGTCVPLVMKGCTCHFENGQMHPLISKRRCVLSVTDSAFYYKQTVTANDVRQTSFNDDHTLT